MAYLTKSSAKPGGTDKRAEAAHRIVALFHTAMILLNPVVEVLASTVKGLAPKNATNSPPIRGVLIRGHPVRFMPDRCDGLFEKRFRRYQIAFFG